MSPSRMPLLRPCELEAQCYYRTLPSRPRLVARSSCHSRPWMMDPDWPRPVYSRLSPFGGESALKEWDAAHGRIAQALNKAGIPWNVLDLARLRFEANFEVATCGLLWIGCPPNSCSFEMACLAIENAQKVLAKYPSLASLEVHVRETDLHRASGRGWSRSDRMDEITQAVMPHSGLAIATVDGQAEGTGGLFFKHKGSTFLLTAGHVLRHEGQFSHGVSLFGPKAFEEYGKKLEKKLQDARSLHTLLITEYLESEKEIEEAKAKVREVNSTRDSIAHVLQEKCKVEERVIGMLSAAVIRDDNGLAEDWAAVEISDPRMVPEENVLFVARHSSVTEKFHLCLRLIRNGLPPAATIAYFSNNGGGEFWRTGLDGIIPTRELQRPRTVDRNNNPSLLVLKRGGATGLTIGMGSGFFSVLRTGEDSYMQAWSVLPEIPERSSDNGEAIAARGDSGAVFVDVNGRAGGMIIGGCGNDEGFDIAYATPLEWLKPRIEEAMGGPISFL